MLATLVATRRGDQDVAGLDIAMDEPADVCGIEGARDLAQEVDDLPRLERPFPQPRLEVRALDIAHRDEQDAVDLAGLVDGQDVGVVDGCRHLRLALESGAVIEVVRQGGRQDLECHAALESALLRAIHDAHATTTDDGLDAIGPEVGADARVGTRRRHGRNAVRSWNHRRRPVEVPIAPGSRGPARGHRRRTRRSMAIHRTAPSDADHEARRTLCVRPRLPSLCRRSSSRRRGTDHRLAYRPRKSTVLAKSRSGSRIAGTTEVRARRPTARLTDDTGRGSALM